jgi:cellulose synthase/poly-beta-1,6-N-acetylglucosamine synthase-like glycosyltransferase
MRTALETIFWVSAGALVYSQLVYPLLVAGFAALKRQAVSGPDQAEDELPTVSLIVAAYAEESVISGKVANTRELDYPAEKLQMIIGCDGSPDRTAALAREAGAEIVLELPRGGKMRAQNAAVEQATGELLAFSDANTLWHPDALRRLVASFRDPEVGYACGEVTFVNEGGTNQEGLYWRYEMWLRRRESRLRSVTAGNGAIYAVRPEAYREISPQLGHDLSLPFNMVKHGWRAIFESRARASEKMVPQIEGEFQRKRRMMANAWPIVLGGGMLSPRGYGPTYLWMIFSHRLLRYAAPLLHLAALVTSAILAFDSTLYLALLIAQLALIAAAFAARVVPARPLLIARYYVLTTASLALGLWDYLRHGTPAGWTPPEGTR